MQKDKELEPLKVLDVKEFGGKGVGSLETKDLALGEWECRLKIEVVNILKEKATFTIVYRNVREIGNARSLTINPYELCYAAPYGSELDESTDLLDFLGYDVENLKQYDEHILDKLDDIAHDRAEKTFNRMVGMLI